MTILEPLEGSRRKRESSRAVQACNDYLRAGAGRSLRELQRAYSERHQKTAPTHSSGTLFRWSSRYNWQHRAELYDIEIEKRKTERAIEIMQSGLALDHERVEHLKRLSDFLEEQIYEQNENDIFYNVWIPDVKQIGSGENSERIDIQRFNSALIDQYRGTLGDIAKETGGRKNKTEISGKDGGPIETKTDGKSSANFEEFLALVELARATRADPPTASGI